MKKVLLTGFEPFGGDKRNPSAEAVTQLYLPKIQTFCIILPVSYKRSFEVLQSAMTLFNPDFLLMAGLAGSRDGISLEKYAYNEMKARIPDCDEFSPQGDSISPTGAPSYQTSADLDLALAALENHNIKASVSEDPGRYVCNRLYYGALEHYKSIPSLFVHVPSFDKMDLETDVSALQIILEELVQ